ncbi:MAG: hypothetical protein ABIV94_09055 [Acidimicrobiales bacterium]
MGQPITVVEKSSSRPGIVRFEINRPLSGMGHERWSDGDLVEGDRPVDELARRLFAEGGIDAVHMNGSVVTVTLARGRDADGLGDVVRSLFRFYSDDSAGATGPPDDGAEGHAESQSDPSQDPAAVLAEDPAPASEPEPDLVQEVAAEPPDAEPAAEPESAAEPAPEPESAAEPAPEPESAAEPAAAEPAVAALAYPDLGDPAADPDPTEPAAALAIEIAADLTAEAEPVVDGEQPADAEVDAAADVEAAADGDAVVDEKPAVDVEAAADGEPEAETLDSK